MRKDGVKSGWAKHSDNNTIGRRGHNKRVRLYARSEVARVMVELLENQHVCRMCGYPQVECRCEHDLWLWDMEHLWD